MARDVPQEESGQLRIPIRRKAITGEWWFLEDKVFHCIVCGKVPHPASRELRCVYCGEISEADFACEDSHFVCESCGLAPPDELILKTSACPTTRFLSWRGTV
ncbi:MAG: hypothetical protein ACTSP1_16545 [Candidatus Freyarchaeota archaeon]